MSFPVVVLVFGHRLEEYFLKSVTEIVLLDRFPNRGNTSEFHSQNAPEKMLVGDGAYAFFIFKPKIDVWAPDFGALWFFRSMFGGVARMLQSHIFTKLKQYRDLLPTESKAGEFDWE